MGFWHTGYMEFHEPTGEGTGRISPKPAIFPCPTCSAVFASDVDLHLHQFRGHAIPRPLLLLKGRQCGQSRVTLTTATRPDDWVLLNCGQVALNGEGTDLETAPHLLAQQRSGVCDVRLVNGSVVQEFQFEFALADGEDLDGVDGALDHLIATGELSRGSIDDFIMRARSYPTAAKYTGGLATYLYGVLARERVSEATPEGPVESSGAYQGKYDQAVGVLGGFDRPPAEAICGIVAFHYNQFERAMYKTKSPRIAAVSMRLHAMTSGQKWSREDLSRRPIGSLDAALSDSVLEQVIGWVSIPLDGSAHDRVADIETQLRDQRPQDALKLHLVLAEHALAARRPDDARRHAEVLRHTRLADNWYADFRDRLSRSQPQ